MSKDIKSKENMKNIKIKDNTRNIKHFIKDKDISTCLLYTSPSPRDTR